MNFIKKITTTIDRLTSLQGSYRRVAKTSPRHFSLKDWRFALLETKNSIGTKNIGMLAAGIAYFTTLSFFPLIAAAVAISTFFISDSQLQDVVTSLNTYLPADIASLISTQLTNALGNESTNMVVAVVAILISLFSVSGAVQNVITATNIIYERSETRNFFKLRFESLLITFGTLCIGFVAICLLALNESILRHIGLPEFLVVIIPYLRWVALAILISTSLATFYRYGPNRKNPHWQWVSWGAVIATVVWLLGTTLFFVYAQYFANFSDTYSLFAGIIVLMTWLNLTAFIVLFGAAINHRLEARTVRRTTK